MDTWVQGKVFLMRTRKHNKYSCKHYILHYILQILVIRVLNMMKGQRQRSLNIRLFCKLTVILFSLTLPKCVNLIRSKLTSKHLKFNI